MTKKILIIDDNIDLRDLIIEFLEEFGFNCIAKDSGKDAIDFLKNNSVDLIVSDLFMPNGDGFFVLNEVKKMELKTPIIISSGRDDNSVANEVLSLGAIKILKKPYMPKQMINEVSKILVNS